MFLQITARPDAYLIAAAVRHSLRRPVLIARLAGWTAIGLSLVGDGLNYTLLFLGVVLAVGVPLLLVNNGARRAPRDLTTYEFTDGGIAFSDRESRHAYAWEALTAVDRLPGQLVFRRGGAPVLQVPTGGVAPGHVDEVLRVALTHGLRVTAGSR